MLIQLPGKTEAPCVFPRDAIPFHVSLEERPELPESACRPGTALLLRGAWPACALMPKCLCAISGAQCCAVFTQCWLLTSLHMFSQKR